MSHVLLGSVLNILKAKLGKIQNYKTDNSNMGVIPDQIWGDWKTDEHKEQINCTN